MLPDIVRDSGLWGPLFALGVFAALVLLAAGVNLAFNGWIARRRRVNPTGMDIPILGAFKGSLVLFFVILGVFLGFLVLTGLTSPRLGFLSGLDRYVHRVWAVVVIIEASYVANRLLGELVAWYIAHVAARTQAQWDDRLLPPVKRLLPLIIYTIGILVILSINNIPISPLLAGLGIGGLAVALALQPTLSNFFAGTYVVTEGELKMGDFIELEGGPSGFVVDIGWRSTKLRSPFNNLVIIPNSKMAESIVTNFTKPTPAVNLVVQSGVSYESDLAHVERVALDVASRLIQESEGAVKDVAPWVGFEEFGDSNIGFFVFVQARDRNASFILKSELIKRIHARFNEEGIEINYPVRKLVFPSTDGQAPLVRRQESERRQPVGGDEGG